MMTNDTHETKDRDEIDDRVADILDQCRHDLAAAYREMVTMPLTVPQQRFLCVYYPSLMRMLSGGADVIAGRFDQEASP